MRFSVTLRGYAVALCAVAVPIVAVPIVAVPAPGTSRTTVVMLGTGSPIPDPERAGPSGAIVVDSIA